MKITTRKVHITSRRHPIKSVNRSLQPHLVILYILCQKGYGAMEVTQSSKFHIISLFMLFGFNLIGSFSVVLSKLYHGVAWVCVGRVGEVVGHGCM